MLKTRKCDATVTDEMIHCTLEVVVLNIFALFLYTLKYLMGGSGKHETKAKQTAVVVYRARVSAVAHRPSDSPLGLGDNGYVSPE